VADRISCSMTVERLGSLKKPYDERRTRNGGARAKRAALHLAQFRPKALPTLPAWLDN